ncbi:MAG TPA: hypothetical protein VEW92_13325 [Nitrososphaeraceae archaeon]|nr:hypothetical protein [Nitrososphaeraceae archaeon]
MDNSSSSIMNASLTFAQENDTGMTEFGNTTQGQTDGNDDDDDEESEEMKIQNI